MKNISQIIFAATGGPIDPRIRNIPPEMELNPAILNGAFAERQRIICLFADRINQAKSMETTRSLSAWILEICK